MSEGMIAFLIVCGLVLVAVKTTCSISEYVLRSRARRFLRNYKIGITKYYEDIYNTMK